MINGNAGKQFDCDWFIPGSCNYINSISHDCAQPHLLPRQGLGVPLAARPEIEPGAFGAHARLPAFSHPLETVF